MASVPQVNPTQANPGQSEIPQELQLALWELLMDLERQDEIPRRYEVKEILQRRLFFRGEQNWWYNDDNFSWMPPNVVPIGMQDVNQPQFQHVTNIFQAFAVSLSSVLSQNNTASRYFPQKPSDPNDVATAKQASKVVDLIHRNNDFQNLVDMMTYFMCTDGFIGSYSRYVSDAEKFGSDPHTVMQEVPQEIPGQAACPQCGTGYPGSTADTPICPDCGSDMQDVPSQTVMVPQAIGQINIPRGQEIVSIVPALQLKRTMYADSQEDLMYLDWITDLHKSIAIATYPSKEQEINSSAGGEGDGGIANSYERIARRILYLGTGRHTGMVLKDLGTFRRSWIRPKSFYGIGGHSDNESQPCKRCQLLQLFPEGVKVVFFNDVFCEAQPEGMDKRWETMHTMQGEGQLRETLVSCIVPIQEQLNDAINLLFEICMYGVPEGFAATDLIDFEARSKQTATAGNVSPVKLLPNQDIRSKMQFTPAVEPSMAMMKYIDMLLASIPQFLTGAFPALFGGDTGSNDTASGISIQRNQALGRIGRAWRRMQVFIANTDAKAVKCFSENRTEDAEVPKIGDSGEFDSDVISIRDMQGNVVAYPELDAQYPTLQADIRGLILSLMNNGNPLFLQTAADPVNLAYVFRQMGLNDIQVPGEQQREKTYGDIEQLLHEQPQEGGMDQTGQPIKVPSQTPDPLVDKLPIALDTCQRWFLSEQGQQAKVQNPQGWQNIYLYAKACDQLAKQEQFQQVAAAQGLQDSGPAKDLAGAEHFSSSASSSSTQGATGSPPLKGAAPGGEPTE